MSDQEEKREEPSQQDSGEVSVKSQTIDLLVANVIPTTRYFENRFDFMQHQINELREGQKRLEDTMNRRFEQAGAEIKDFKASVDKRFEQVGAEIKEFKASVDKRFEQMIASIDRLSDKLDRRDTEQRSFTMRMFTIAVSISFLGVMGVLLKIIGIL